MPAKASKELGNRVMALGAWPRPGELFLPFVVGPTDRQGKREYLAVFPLKLAVFNDLQRSTIMHDRKEDLHDA
ncbi:hypothetical protein Geu3261_0002_001 [Komagataeibacter europaeus NBRC 3261]|uniref:Uncharacterized protein n=1 Tax=Komagataeibacter europaeus NBRC 3261 TaxID=1234669 RepID=A0A0D6PV78_KOMEU|nr:hypothetical protein Geu3261_0002_001 [Komagataeibacter europaeus NBRC 3261]